MKTIFTACLAALLVASCDPRPLVVSCNLAAECGPDEWCVHTWWDDSAKVRSEPVNVCAPFCSSGGDCETGCCARIGDGATVNLSTTLTGFACAPADRCK